MLGDSARRGYRTHCLFSGPHADPHTTTHRDAAPVADAIPDSDLDAGADLDTSTDKDANPHA